MTVKVDRIEPNIAVQVRELIFAKELFGSASILGTTSNTRQQLSHPVETNPAAPDPNARLAVTAVDQIVLNFCHKRIGCSGIGRQVRLRC